MYTHIYTHSCAHTHTDKNPTLSTKSWKPKCQQLPNTGTTAPCPSHLRPRKNWLTLGRNERVGRVGSCWAFWVPQGWKSLKHSLQKVARHSVQPLVASSGGGLHSWHRMAPPTLTLCRYLSTTRSRVRFRKSPERPLSPSSTSPWQAGHGNMIVWGCKAPRFRPGYVPKPVDGPRR